VGNLDQYKKESFAGPASGLTAQASRLLTRGTNGDGVYFLVPPRSAPLWGTLGADWVQSKTLSDAALSTNGLLLSDGQFLDNFAGKSIAQPWLQVEAALATINERIYPPVLSVFL
jgi:hypothetical protein